jgi:hypothetical protein
MKAVLLSARWAGRRRRLGLEQEAKTSGDGAQVQAENGTKFSEIGIVSPGFSGVKYHVW